MTRSLWMESIAGPDAPALRTRRSRRARHVVGILAILSLVLATVSWLAVLALRPSGGYLTSPTATFRTSTAALTTDEIEVTDTEARAGNPSPDLGEYATVRIRAASLEQDESLFIGVGPKAQVEAYLSSSEHESFVWASLDPLRATFAHHPGTQAPAVPAEQNFWVASSLGAGTQTIEWNKGPGAWTLVVMHPDGRSGVGATMDVGLRFGQLAPLAIVAALVGAVSSALWAWSPRLFRRQAARSHSGRDI